jgi:uncharacterized repeat protein (TIGR03803 family)
MTGLAHLRVPEAEESNMNTRHIVARAPASKKSVLLNAAGLLAVATAGGLLLAPPAEAKGPEKVLYSFCSQKHCTDGTVPAGGLLESGGNFYGVADGGGANDGGAVWELTPGGTESVLYSFCALDHCSDGSGPNVVTPIEDGAGNLYGTTAAGGSVACNCGTVWKLSPANGQWTETVLHTFTGQGDGGIPFNGLVADANGNLYGAAASGGKGNCVESQINLTGCGTVFEITADGTFSILYRFKGGSDGANPNAKLTLDDKGDLYGTTLAGGTGGCNIVGTSGCGTVFELSPTRHPGGATWTKKTVYSFLGGSDGANPIDFGGLLLSGNILYGTNYDGGTGNSGTVFKLTTDGAENVIYTFTGEADGGNPWGGLIADTNGNLYGTGQNGGTGYSGVVFEITAAGSESVLYSFCSLKSCKDGYGPVSELMADSTLTHLYGAAEAGGAHAEGVAYSVHVPK